MRRFSGRAWVGILILALAVGLASLAGFAEYSASPSFCHSCHIMDPYYKAWQASPHRHVACVDCHYPPSSPRDLLWRKFQSMTQVVKYMTKTYGSKPYATVDDRSCLRSSCHSEKSLEGPLQTRGGIYFDHGPHLRSPDWGKRLKCVSCHSQKTVGVHIETRWEACFLCHLTKNASKEGRGRPLECRSCHSLPEAPILSGGIKYSHKDFLARHKVDCASCHEDAVQGRGEVRPENCYNCHNSPDRISHFGDQALMHEVHVGKENISCGHCHEPPLHGGAKAGHKNPAQDCSSCHGGSHRDAVEFYKGHGIRGLDALPSPMYLANVACSGCHLESGAPDHRGERTLLGSEKACMRCHAPAYKGIQAEARALALETQKALSAKLRTLEEGAGLEDGDLADAKANLDLLARVPVLHNIYYAARGYQATDDLLNSFAARKGKKGEDLSGLPLVGGSFCGSLCHAKLGVEVPPQEARWKGRAVPHKEHVESGKPCRACHIFGGHKEVRLREEACQECHEKADIGLK